MATAPLLLWCVLAGSTPTEVEDGGIPATVASDDDLRAQLAQALEQLKKHEAAIEQLSAPKPVAPPPSVTPPTAKEKKESVWWESIKIRGYTQLRYNAPGLVYNDKLTNEQGDRSMGGNGGFLIRRARLILYGDVHPRVSIYLQPDFASVIGEQLGVAILRDWYADIAFDDKREFRIRVGQSKVPYGFENMQSSQNRLPLDRNDALNSAVRDERDLGAFFYWAPSAIRARFKHLVDSGLKGSGDYGVLALGVYNGQSANRPELNKFPHVVARATYPFELLTDQMMELGVGGYYGNYTIAVGNLPDGTKVTSARPNNTFPDARAAVTAVLYPKPFGVQFEYTAGVGPELDGSEVRTAPLYGGYVTLSLKLDGVLGTVSLIPFVRGAMYNGGKKFFVNSPRYHVRELEAGVEWQIFKAAEVVLAYNISERTNDRSYQLQTGHWTRLQVQFNY